MTKSLFLAMVLLLSSGCLKPVLVEGIAMQPSFYDGDRLLMSDNLDDLRRYDVVYFKFPKDQTKAYLKRIVGLPGERIEIRNGSVLIDGNEISEQYIDVKLNEVRPTFPETVIPPDSYYVLGDNRDNSSDSRYWGVVERRLIVGKYYARYYNAAKN